MKPVIVWDKPAYASLQQAYNYIKKDSLGNAEKVQEGILKIADSLADHPEKQPKTLSHRDKQGIFPPTEKRIRPRIGDPDQRFTTFIYFKLKTHLD